MGRKVHPIGFRLGITQEHRARWFAEELLKRQNGNLLWALMSHNAGPDAVDRWKVAWRRLGRADDIEFMVDTARFGETRGFAQRALSALWLARATPRAWLEQGKRISVKNAPTHYGTVGYEIVSDADNGKITATIGMPTRNPPSAVVLRLRHPKALPIKGVAVDGQPGVGVGLAGRGRDIPDADVRDAAAVPQVGQAFRR